MTRDDREDDEPARSNSPGQTPVAGRPRSGRQEEDRGEQVEADVEQDRLGELPGANRPNARDHREQQQRRHEGRGARVEQVDRRRRPPPRSITATTGRGPAQQRPQQQAPEQQLLDQWGEAGRPRARPARSRAPGCATPCRRPAAPGDPGAICSSSSTTPMATTWMQHPGRQPGPVRGRAATRPKSRRSDPRPLVPAHDRPARRRIAPFCANRPTARSMPSGSRPRGPAPDRRARSDPPIAPTTRPANQTQTTSPRPQRTRPTGRARRRAHRAQAKARLTSAEALPEPRPRGNRTVAPVALSRTRDRHGGSTRPTMVPRRGRARHERGVRLPCEQSPTRSPPRARQAARIPHPQLAPVAALAPAGDARRRRRDLPVHDGAHRQPGARPT